MLYHPFTTTNTNIVDERSQSAAPTNVFGQNLLVSQEAHRKIFDTLTTSYQPYCYQNPQNNSVTFAFGPQQYQTNRNDTYYQPSCWPTSNNQQSRLNQLQQSNALELIRLRRQFEENPYQIKFHVDHDTTTNDLPLITKCSPDLNNLLQSRWPYWLDTPECLSNHRKLILKKKFTPKIEGNIYDCLEETAKHQCRMCCVDRVEKQTQCDPKKVCCKQNQAHFCCECCNLYWDDEDDHCLKTEEKIENILKGNKDDTKKIRWAKTGKKKSKAKLNPRTHSLTSLSSSDLYIP